MIIYLRIVLHWLKIIQIYIQYSHNIDGKQQMMLTVLNRTRDKNYKETKIESDHSKALLLINI